MLKISYKCLTANPSAVADGTQSGVSPQRPSTAPKPGCEGEGLTHRLTKGNP